VHVSLLPPMYGRQVYAVNVGCAPKRVYKSASPVPPLIVNVNVDCPAGTSIDQNFVEPCAPAMPVTGTPLVNVELPAAVTVSVKPVACAPDAAVPVIVRP
jgi:hypothetical protein